MRRMLFATLTFFACMATLIGGAILSGAELFSESMSPWLTVGGLFFALPVAIAVAIYTEPK